MVYLDTDPALVGAQSAQRLGKAQQVRYAWVDVVRDYTIRGTVFGAQFACQPLVEKCRDGRYAAVTGNGADIRRWLDSQARYARGDDMLQQIAVISNDFDYRYLSCELQPHRRSVV